jgi:hypothetical protein
MEIRQKTINGNKWQLVNETWETSNSWGHKTTILKNGGQYITHKVRYYNRTWECYTYESCMSGSVEELKERELNMYIDNYKFNNNISHFRKGEKEKVLEAFKETKISKELDILKDAIKNRQFD